MSRNQKKQNTVEVTIPNTMSRDELTALNADQLEQLRARYELELSLITERTESDPAPWEVELCYVERALEKRRAYDAITPPEFRN